MSVEERSYKIIAEQRGKKIAELKEKNLKLEEQVKALITTNGILQDKLRKLEEEAKVLNESYCTLDLIETHFPEIYRQAIEKEEERRREEEEKEKHEEEEEKHEEGNCRHSS